MWIASAYIKGINLFLSTPTESAEVLYKADLFFYGFILIQPRFCATGE